MSARALSLGELARLLGGEGLLAGSAPDTDVVVTGVVDDSRAVRGGELFCAWVGTSADSHGYAASAVKAGAVALMVERPLADLAVPQLVVSHGRRGAALAGSLFHGRPEQALRMTGVTGTNGKTTSVWMLRHMLSIHAPSASLGTLGTILEDGSLLPGSDALTTPGPIEIARTLRLLVDRGVRDVAMEVSSHALDQGRVHALRFDAAVFTNLSRDHLDYHGTLETYLGAKRSLVGLLKRDGWAIVNADDPAWAGIPAEAPRALSFSTRSGADVMALDVRLRADGASFALRTPSGTAPAYVPLPGEFNVHNALGAAATCIAYGFTLDETVAALAGIPQVPGRLERIAERPCPVLRDYAHTPDALERVLATMRPLTRGRLIVVFGAGGDRDRGKRAEMGAVSERLADIAIVTSDNPRTEDPDAIIDEIETGMRAGRHVRITDRREAIAHALDAAAPDDVVVLAGKGHETYQIVGTEKQPFDERAVVRTLLEARS